MELWANPEVLLCVLQVLAETCQAADAKEEAGDEAEGTAGCCLALACPHAHTPGQKALPMHAQGCYHTPTFKLQASAKHTCSPAH